MSKVSEYGRTGDGGSEVRINGSFPTVDSQVGTRGYDQGASYHAYSVPYVFVKAVFFDIQ